MMTSTTASTDAREQPVQGRPPVRLHAVFEALGRREKDVAREVLRDYPISALGTVAMLARRSKVSTATVLRLVRRVGFATFGAFQDAVKLDLNRLLQSPSDRLAPPGAPAEPWDSFLDRSFGRAAENLASGPDAIMKADFRELVDLLADPKRQVFCIGGRYSRHVAGLLADYLGVLRPGVTLVTGQADGWSRVLVDIGPRAIVIVVDIRRYQRTIRRFAGLAAECGARVVLVTDPWAEDAWADIVFRLPTAAPSLMDSLAGPFVFAETLVGALAERLGADLHERLALCEAMDCVEGDLRLAWPGVAKAGE